MKRLVDKYGKLITASFFVMAIGVILFLLTPIFYGQWGIDTDLIGLITLTTGLAILLIGIIRRKKLRGWKLVILIILIALLLYPLVPLVVTTTYYLITGKALW